MWFQTINEELAQPTVSEPTVAEPEVSVKLDRAAMLADVDNIMTSLETLAGELKESIEAEEVEELDEATEYAGEIGSAVKTAGAVAAVAAGGVGLAVNAIINWAKIPGARKQQAQINSLHLKAVQLEETAEAAEDENQKERIKARAAKIKEQAEKLEDALDTKYTASSIQKAIRSERLKGDIEIAKFKLEGATDAQKQELQASLKKYAEDYKKSVEELKKLEPSEEDKKKAAEAKKKKEDSAKSDTKKEGEEEAKGEEEENPAAVAAAAAKEAEAEKKAEAEKEAEAEDAEPKKEEEPAKEEDPTAAKEAEIKTINDNIEAERDRISKLDAELKKAQSDLEKATDPAPFEEKIKKLKKDIEDSKEDIAELKKTEEAAKRELSKMTPKESLVIRATNANLNELAAEISEKAEWQLNGTVLYTKYDTMIRKAEATNYLNESLAISIKDKFSKLL